MVCTCLVMKMCVSGHKFVVIFKGNKKFQLQSVDSEQ